MFSLNKKYTTEKKKIITKIVQCRKIYSTKNKNENTLEK